MYPTLNISLLAQPGNSANSDVQASPLLEAADVDLAESFEASLARSLLRGGDGGNSLPLDGTSLPEPGLSASVMIDEPAFDAGLVEAVPVDMSGIELLLSGELVQGPLPPADATAELAPEPGPSLENLPVTAGPASGTAMGPAALAAAPEGEPAGVRPGLASAGSQLQPAQAAPASGTLPAPDPKRVGRTPPVPVDSGGGQEFALRAAEADSVAAEAATGARDFGAQRAELAANPAESPASRPGEQRPVLSPAASPIEPAAVLASVTRATINIATPAQVSAAQPAAAEVAIQTPVGEPGFDDAIADRVWVMTQARLNNAEIRLTPAELGPVRIQVAVDDGTANVSFQAAQAATREAIEQALPRLRELLADNGLSLGQASVGEDGVRDGQRDLHEQAAGAIVSDDTGEEIDTGSASIEAPRSGRNGYSLVDTFA